ncbi:hypothetical protein QBC46DRAFT_77340 [Diplogelasinospora grovesii]|uniref:Uncharacterized protein n=1 Tax=Diplogelasinospora grovesii TaxID=303347 RepID=A0AAN6NBM9_9PEZI|nr:hypothetical protein QBC46DRAFT_77340 [Diplogelasinospora grovesii]
MAFHQPTRQLQQRVARVEAGDLEPPALSPQALPTPSESQTWILFSPATDAGTTTSYLSSVQDEQPTPGRSRLSDLGSLDTAARSDINSQPQNSGVPLDFLEDDAELDSLDSHLAEFRTVPNPYSQQSVLPHTAPVLPGHDGLGSFRIETRGMSVEAQERLYAFEKFNPNRVKRRKESFDLAQLELENGEEQELERNRRIEAWRLEQSRVLLDEIQKETRRRRRQSDASSHKVSSTRNLVDNVATMPTVDGAAHDAQLSGSDWHDQDEPKLAEPREGLWSRITRKVICDLMGIDDKLLSILFGEALPDEEDLSSTPKASAMQPSSNSALASAESESSHDSTWQLHVLERISRELGLLVHQLSSHPGAFSTYSRIQEMPLPYAGLPVIPETVGDMSESSPKKVEESVPSMPQFRPTITQPVDIPGSRPFGAPTLTLQSVGDLTSAAAPPAFTQQEWEQELDIKLVFRYLRSRFTSSRSSSPPFTSGTSHLATSSTQDVAAKAARIRQHHPLVSHSHLHQRPRPAERRAHTFKATAPASPVALRHASGSCASQSTRRSTRRGSVSSRHSSRHYWDIGGSIGTGSMIASTGPMGSWGEV